MLDDIADLGWPLFVKPARGGSSIGTSKAHDMAQLHEARSATGSPVSTTRKCWSRPPSTGRRCEESPRCWRASTAPCQDTSIPRPTLLVEGGEEFLGLRGQVPGLRPAGWRSRPPSRDSAPWRRSAASVQGRVFDAVSCEGLARGRFLLHHRRPGPGKRDQHHAGPVPGLVLPEDVGSQRHAVPPADRPAAANGSEEAVRACVSASGAVDGSCPGGSGVAGKTAVGLRKCVHPISA